MQSAGLTCYEWTTTAGSVEMIGPQEWGLHGSWAWFTAPSNAIQHVTVKVEVRNAVIETPFTVAAPEGYDPAFTKIINTYPTAYPTGQVAAAMRIKVVLKPTEVSFYRIHVAEVGRPATNIEGYFTNFSSNSLYHATTGVFVDISEFNSMYSPVGEGDKCYLEIPQWPGLYRPLDGGFHWDIPAQWKIGDDHTNELNGWSGQDFLLDANGSLTIKKFGRQVTRGTNGVVNPWIVPIQ